MISIWKELLSKLYRLAYESCTECDSKQVDTASLSNQYNGIIAEFWNKLISIYDLKQHSPPQNVDDLISILEKLLTFANNSIDSKVFGNTFTIDKKSMKELEKYTNDDNEEKHDKNNLKVFPMRFGIKLCNYCKCDNIDESILLILKLKINYNNIINENNNNNNVCNQKTDTQNMNDELISNTNNNSDYSYDDIQDDLFHFMYNIFGGFIENGAIHFIIDYFGLKIEDSYLIERFLKIHRLSFDVNDSDGENKFNIYDKNINTRLKDIMQNKYDKRLLLYEMFLRENVSLMLRNKMDGRDAHDCTALDCSIKLNNNDINQLIIKYANVQTAGINQCCSSTC